MESLTFTFSLLALLFKGHTENNEAKKKKNKKETTLFEIIEIQAVKQLSRKTLHCVILTFETGNQ